jgi:hypothetical protein
MNFLLVVFGSLAFAAINFSIGLSLARWHSRRRSHPPVKAKRGLAARAVSPRRDNDRLRSYSAAQAARSI